MGVYVDEVYVARESGFNADLLDIQRVEVLKGPQGTLFGRNTAVGAINISTKKPADEFEGMVLADVGDYDYQRYGALVNGPITDNLAAKISGVYNERDGYLDNTYGGTVNTVDYYTFRGQVLWAPMERLELLLIGDYRKDTSDGNNLVTRYQESLSIRTMRSVFPIPVARMSRPRGSHSPPTTSWIITCLPP